MPLTNLCLALALVFAAVAETNINKDGDVVVKFDGDHGLTSEKKEVDRFQYTLHNLTPSAVDGHGRVKRLQQAVGGDEALPLCIMTFNIRTNTFEGGVATHEDMVIARVSYYPARACASKGLCDRSWCLFLFIYISARTFFYLSKYSLSDAHFSTGRLLFEFNRLQYTLAAPEVFVSSANPVILPSGYRVSIVRNTNI